MHALRIWQISSIDVRKKAMREENIWNASIRQMQILLIKIK
jgi:hypothetical protein